MKNPGLWLVSRVPLSFYGYSADASVITSCSRAMHFFNIRNTRSGKNSGQLRVYYRYFVLCLGVVWAGWHRDKPFVSSPRHIFSQPLQWLNTAGQPDNNKRYYLTWKIFPSLLGGLSMQVCVELQSGKLKYANESANGKLGIAHHSVLRVFLNSNKLKKCYAIKVYIKP